MMTASVFYPLQPFADVVRVYGGKRLTWTWASRAGFMVIVK